jgi:CRP-like cAMP-binding protein
MPAITLRSYLEAPGVLSPAELEEALSFFRVRELHKKTFLQEAGEVCAGTAFVEQGCLRSYTMSGELRENILRFATEGWWASDLDSFYSGEPSDQYLQAVEDTRIQWIDRADFLTLLDRHPYWKEVHMTKVREAYKVMIERMNSLRQMSAEERYRKLLEERPDLVLRVPLQQLASYLDLEPQSLSRVRARVAAG